MIAPRTLLVVPLSLVSIIREVAVKEKVGLIDIRKESDRYEGGKMTLEDVHLHDVGHKVYGDMIGNDLAEKH